MIGKYTYRQGGEYALNLLEGGGGGAYVTKEKIEV